MKRIACGFGAGILLACCAANAQTLADWNLANPANQPSAAGQPAPKPAPKPLLINVPQPAPSKPGALTNSKVLSMLKAGLPAGVVAAKLRLRYIKRHPDGDARAGRAGAGPHRNGRSSPYGKNHGRWAYPSFRHRQPVMGDARWRVRRGKRIGGVELIRRLGEIEL